ncbi:MAG: hypothetical protein V2I40_03940, partial [Desulfobacteraceae bacterium]|nr:hypothetical protein [Desulfobacteraceae bacterium]
MNPIDLPVIERVLDDQDISGGDLLPTAQENKAQTVSAAESTVKGNERLEKLETELRELRTNIFKRLVALEKNNAGPGKTIENLQQLLAEE